MESRLATSLGAFLPMSSLRVAMFRIGGVEFGSRPQVKRLAFLKGSSFGDDCEIRSHARVICAQVGAGSVIDIGALILGTAQRPVRIGNDAYIGYYNILDGSGGLSIGNSVHMSGPCVAVWTHSTIGSALRGDDLKNTSHRLVAPVEVGDRVWIGAQVTIYPGVRIGSEAVILPHTVVNRNVMSGTMIGGVPGKVVRENVSPDDFDSLTSR